MNLYYNKETNQIILADEIMAFSAYIGPHDDPVEKAKNLMECYKISKVNVSVCPSIGDLKVDVADPTQPDAAATTSGSDGDSETIEGDEG